MQMERWLGERKDLDPRGETASGNWSLKINLGSSQVQTRQGEFLGSGTLLGAGLGPGEVGVPPS